MLHTPREIAIAKGLLLVVGLAPATWLAYAFATDQLGANPIEALLRNLGLWTLRFLLITLAVTPLRRLTGWNGLLRLRRMLGLFTFFYACLHLLTYVVLDQYFDWMAIALDVVKHPYVTVGFAAFVLMVPLAATSNHWSVRRLGGRRWQELHRTVYPIAILGVVHFWWLVKQDISRPAFYALVAALLLGLRMWWREQERRRQLAAALPRGPRPGARVIPIQPRP